MFKFDHVALSVSNIKQSLNFYRKLGFSFYKEYNDPTGALSIVLLQNENMTLELFSYKNFKPLPEYRIDNSKDLEVVGTKHLGLCVDDIKQMAKIVVEKGVVDDVPVIKTGRLGRDYFFIKDPDGINIEIIQK